MHPRMVEAVTGAIRRVIVECDGKTMGDIVDMCIAAKVAIDEKYAEGCGNKEMNKKELETFDAAFRVQTSFERLRKNILVVLVATRTNDAWSKDVETATWWRNNHSMLADMFSTEDIMKYTLNCIHTKKRKQICMNCRGYDMELYKRNAFMSIVAMHQCRRNHGVDLDKEMATPIHE